MAETKIIPSAQPVKRGPRPTFNNRGGLVPKVKVSGPAFEPSRHEQGAPRQP